MKVELKYEPEDGLPLIELIPETDEELDTLSTFASFEEVHIRWDRHEEVCVE